VEGGKFINQLARLVWSGQPTFEKVVWGKSVLLTHNNRWIIKW